MLPGNDEAIEAWNTILFDKFVQYRHLLVDGLGAHGTRAIDLHPPPSGGRVVDIGCGFGDTTLELARRVGASGNAVGVDAAARFIDQARSEAQAVPNVRFEVSDVEQAVPGGPYDHAFSRMGTMFFAAPVRALRNIRASLVSGAKLCMVVWRKKEENEAFHRAEQVVRELLGDPPKGDQVTCGPGPFSMASPDVVSDQLIAAGYRDPSFMRHDAPIKIGNDIDEAVRFGMTLGPAGEVVRLSGDEGVRRNAEIVDALTRAVREYQQADGVWAPSSTWIVTATAP